MLNVSNYRRLGCAIVLMASLVSGCRKGEDPKGAGPPQTALQDRSDDLRALIAGELAAGNKRIVIPEGRYRVDTERGQHLAFRELRNVEIIAYDVEMVCTSTIAAMVFDRCSNVTVRGLTIDYDPLPFTQGKIVSMTEDKRSLVFEVADGYPENRLEERIQIYDAATAELRRGDARWKPEIESLGERCYRVSKVDGYKFDADRDTEQVGDILVTNNKTEAPGAPHAILLRDCQRMHFEDVTLHASPSFGFLEKDCDRSTYIRCTIDRRDPADDPVARAFPRMRSLNVDAFHSKDATIGPAIIACTARYHGDDCVNINGEYHYVAGSRDGRLRIAVPGKLRLVPGDPVQFLPHSGARPADAKVVSLELDDSPLSEGERAFIQQLRMDERTRQKLLSDETRFFTLTMDRGVSLPPGSAVCCPLRIGSGFAVTDCDFGHNRSRGILIKASNGEVSRNRISHSRMAAVLITPEFWWMEGGVSSDVVVQDNVIQGSLQAPIQVLAPGGNQRPLPVGAHQNISILNNQIKDGPWPLIRITSTSGLVLEGNTLPDAPDTPPGPDGKLPERIVLKNTERKPAAR